MRPIDLYREPNHTGRARNDRRKSQYYPLPAIHPITAQSAIACVPVRSAPLRTGAAISIHVRQRTDTGQLIMAAAPRVEMDVAYVW